MIILATYKRRNNLERFIRAYKKTGATEPVKLVMDNNDLSYDGMQYPETFSELRIPPRACASERANVVYRNFPNESYYAIMADDVEPLTDYWDVTMKAACGEWKMAYCADGIQNRNLPTHPFMGGKFVRAQGFIEEPSVHDWFADNCRKDVAYALNLSVYVEDVKFMHHHHVNGKAPLDETYTKQWSHSDDAYLYQRWLRQGGFKKTVDRVRKAMHG